MPLPEQLVNMLVQQAMEMDEDYPGKRKEYVRLKSIEIAVELADRVIIAASDGSVEETDYLTSQVALKFSEKIANALTSKLLRKMMNEESKSKDVAQLDFEDHNR